MGYSYKTWPYMSKGDKYPNLHAVACIGETTGAIVITHRRVTQKVAGCGNGTRDRLGRSHFEPVLIRIPARAMPKPVPMKGNANTASRCSDSTESPPETETTTHYFWSMATNIIDGDTPDLAFEQTVRTFKEDQAALELQQQRMEAEPSRPIDIASDVSGRQTRQFINRLRQVEQEVQAVGALGQSVAVWFILPILIFRSIGALYRVSLRDIFDPMLRYVILTGHEVVRCSNMAMSIWNRIKLRSTCCAIRCLTPLLL